VKGCVTVPVRLFLLTVLVVGAYLAWQNRDDVRRWIHRKTGDSVVVAPKPRPGEAIGAESRAEARLDSIKRGRADSVILSAAEVTSLFEPIIRMRSGSAVESLTVSFEDGRLKVRGRLDAAQLPRAVIGPLGEWLNGRQSVEAAGPVVMRRVGLAEWQVDQVKVRGVPLPKPLWQRAVGLVAPGETDVVPLPLDEWITGLRVTSAGVVLYGKRTR
jgi:hypothetical protein